MKVHRYSEHQRRMWVHEMMHKTKTIKAICNEAAISRATLYNWVSELKSMDEKAEGKPLPESSSISWQPNDKYKMLLSALIKTDADKTISGKLARELVKRYNLTPAQACAIVSMPEELYGYRPRKPEAEDKEVYAALVHLLEEKKNRSLEECIAILQSLHPHWAIKQIKRIYRQGRLYLKRTRIPRIASLPIHTECANQNSLPARLYRESAFWYIGLIKEERFWLLFLLDYADGTPLNVLTGDDEMSEEKVMQFIRKAALENGLPKKVRIPAVEPFSGRDISKWSWENRVAIYHLSMAKPENLLEAQYIQDDIKKQLDIAENTTQEMLQVTSENWIKSFAQNKSEAVNYFVKETVV